MVNEKKMLELRVDKITVYSQVIRQVISTMYKVKLNTTLTIKSLKSSSLFSLDNCQNHNTTKFQIYFFFEILKTKTSSTKTPKGKNPLPEISMFVFMCGGYTAVSTSMF